MTMEKLPTDLRSLVDETMQALEPLANEKKVQMIVEIGELPLLNVDPVRIRQVLFNLLSNALRHTHADGTIRVLGEQKKSIESTNPAVAKRVAADLAYRLRRQ